VELNGISRRVNFGYRYTKYLVQLLILSIVTMTGCSQQEETSLRVGMIDWIGYETFFIAEDIGSFDEAKVKLVELKSESDAIYALRAANLEAAALTLDEALSLVQSGIDLRIILIIDVSNGADALLVKPYIENLEDLHNRKVAVDVGMVGALVLDAVLEKAGLKVNDISVIACRVDEHEVCYEKADAVITYEPERTRILNKGAKELFNSSQMNGQIVDVLVVRTEVLSSHPNSLKQLISGYFNALDYMEKHPKKTAGFLVHRLNLSAEVIPTLYKGITIPSLDENYVLLDDGAESIEIKAKQMVEYMLAKKLLIKNISVDQLADKRFLPPK
jgi:NitT/TauT family transport system substrate-binding protein